MIMKCGLRAHSPRSAYSAQLATSSLQCVAPR